MKRSASMEMIAAFPLRRGCPVKGISLFVLWISLYNLIHS